MFELLIKSGDGDVLAEAETEAAARMWSCFRSMAESLPEQFITIRRQLPAKRASP